VLPAFASLKTRQPSTNRPRGRPRKVVISLLKTHKEVKADDYTREACQSKSEPSIATTGKWH
jgi:hypothetical protein